MRNSVMEADSASGTPDSSEPLFENLFRYSADGVLIARADGTIVRANPAACAALGRSEAEIRACGGACLVALDEGVRVHAEQLARHGASRGEFTFIRPDGSRFPVEITSSIIHETGGVPLYSVVFRDISERKRSEVALARVSRAVRMLTRCHEAMLRSTSEAELLASSCEAIVDAGGYRMCWVGFALGDAVRTICPVACAGFEEGYLSEVRVVANPAEQAGRGPIGTALRENRVVAFQDFATDPALAPWRDAALARGYRRVAALPLIYQGEMLGAIGMYGAEPGPFDAEEMQVLTQLAEDLAFGMVSLRRREAARRAEREREQTLETLAQERERLDLTLRSICDAVIAADADGVITLFNPVAEALTGWNASEAIGRRVDEVVSATSEMGAAAAPLGLERVLRGGAVVTLAAGMVLVSRDGAHTAIGGRIAPRRNVDGAGSGAVVVLWDETEERLAQKALRESEERFQQSQKLESVGRLAGGVAHDFNNLLSVILSCSDALRSDLRRKVDIDPEDVDEIHTAAERARDLTRQLLTFARRQVMEPVPLELNEVVRNSEKLLRRVIREDIALAVALAPGLWKVRCDPGQVEQVLMNLAINARDAMPRGGWLSIETANVTVTAEQVGEQPGLREGPYVRLDVRDTGEGMSAEVMAHIFEPFFTTKPQGKGTGLGLATVYGIVNQSGGVVQVESELGAGTTFSVLLPRYDEPGIARTLTPRPALKPGTETVLVIEDDPQLRAVTTRMLRAGGYTVLVAGSGLEGLAVAAAEPGPIHLAVMDVVLPGLGGRAAADALRAQRRELRVLFVSGHSDDDAVEDGAGVDAGSDFLAKPFSAAMLLSRARALLDR